MNSASTESFGYVELERRLLGVERAVTRWYIQRQIILNEIATLQAKLNDTQPPEQEVVMSDTVVTTALVTDGAVTSHTAAQTPEECLRQLAQAEEKLQALGACPRPMMG